MREGGGGEGVRGVVIRVLFFIESLTRVMRCMYIWSYKLSYTSAA